MSGAADDVRAGDASGGGPTCHIVSAAPEPGLEIELRAGDLLVAADGGYRLCEAAGFVPDLLIGDFDSLGADAAAHAHAGETVVLPCAKDDTDTMAAVRAGLARGYGRFELHAALGGDVGHELANLQVLSFIRAHGAQGCLHGHGQTVFLVLPEDGACELSAAEGTRVSVLAFAGDARGVRERGLRWELSDATLSASYPLGVSNEALGGTFEVSVRFGRLLVVVG